MCCRQVGGEVVRRRRTLLLLKEKGFWRDCGLRIGVCEMMIVLKVSVLVARCISLARSLTGWGRRGGQAVAVLPVVP